MALRKPLVLRIDGTVEELPSSDSVGVGLTYPLTFPAEAAEPATPSADTVTLYAKTIAPNLTVLKVKRPSGDDTAIQDSIQFNRVLKWQASGGGLAPLGVATFIVVGTQGSVTISSGSAKSAAPRVRNTSAATAGSLVSYHCNGSPFAPVFRGGVAGEGGFKFVVRFALQTLVADNRGFWGLSDVPSAPTNIDPTTNTTPGKVGLAINANTGNMRLVHNVTGTAPTIIDLGANFPVDTTSLYELLLFARPHNGISAGDISYRVRRYTTSSADPAFEATGTLTTNIPAATTILHPVLWMTNNATASAVSFHTSSVSVESDW